MKKRMRRVLSALLTFTMVFSLANFTVAAGDDDPTVVYNVATEKFSFENVEVYEHTEEGAHAHPQNVDLFRDMKNAMPGDTFTQHIKLKVQNIGNATVNMYLRAENPNEDYFTLTGETPVVEAPDVDVPDETPALPAVEGDVPEAPVEGAPVLRVEYNDVVYGGTLNGGIKLAEFTSAKEEQEIDVILDIPLEAGNELQGLIAEIDWVFAVEVIPGGGGGGTHYDVTVNYLDKETGKKIASSYEERHPSGFHYDVTDKDAIAIEGYTYDRTTGDPLKGVMNGDKVINVYYTKDEEIPEPPVPVDPKPPVDPEPPVDIDEPEIPFVPKTGDSSMLWLMLAAASGIGLVLLLLTSRKKEEA